MGEGLIVRRGGGAGSPEGLNVWIKRNRQAGQKATIRISFLSYEDSNKWNFKVTSDNELVPVSSLDASIFVGMTAKVKFDDVGSDYYQLSFKANGTGTYYPTTNPSYVKNFSWAWDATTGVLKISSFVSNKSASESGWTIDNRIANVPYTDYCYVVDDEPTAFPDGDYGSDGYWYDLIASISEASVASLSDAVVASVQEDYREQVESEVSQS